MTRLKVEVRSSDGHVEMFDVRNPNVELFFRVTEARFVYVMANTANKDGYEEKALAAFYKPISVKFIEDSGE